MLKERNNEKNTKIGLNPTSHFPPHTSNKGITLIALIITIIVMLILVAVTISMAINGGLFEKAGQAAKETQDAINAEQKLADGRIKIGDFWYASIDDYLNNNPIRTGITVDKEALELKKKATAEEEGEEVLTGTITASVFGMETEPEIRWEVSPENQTAVTLSGTTGKTITVTAVGTAAATVTVAAKCSYEGTEYTATSNVTLKTLKVASYTEAAKANGYLTEKATYSDGVETNPAVIPVGYKVVNDGEKIANGIVIEDSNNNEFVWIPVEKAIVTESEIAQIIAEDSEITTYLEAVQKMVNNGTYPMAVEVNTKDGEGNVTETNYKGILYSFSGTDTLTLTVRDWTSTSSYREPAVFSNYDTQTNFTTYGLGTYSNTLYKNAYNKMVQSVAKNGGFYVGRYEISLYTDAEDSTIKYAQSKVNQTALVDTTWYEMYKYERDYSTYNTNLGVTSEMIWGSQWDQMMIFVNGKNDGAENPAKFYVRTTGSRNSRDRSMKTGMNAVDKVANIFDLEASRYEWTQEAGSSYGSRVYRGGYDFDQYWASYRVDHARHQSANYQHRMFFTSRTLYQIAFAI